MKSIWIAVVLVLLALPASAQDDTQYSNRDGTFGVLFSFNELKLNSLKGGLGLKYWLSDLWALGGTVILERDDRTVKDNPAKTVDDDITTGIGIAVERHLGRSRLTPYVGAGLSYKYTRDTSTFTDSTFSTEDKSTYHSASAALNLGVEFRVTQHFSLAGQYGLVGTYSRAKNVRSRPNTATLESTSDNISISMGAAALVLAVYF